MKKCNFCKAEASSQITFEDENGSFLRSCFECAQKFIKNSFEQKEFKIEVPSGTYKEE